MNNFRYLLDENVGLDLQKSLQRSWRDMVVWHIDDPGTPPNDTPDPAILLWCEAHQFSLVTNNRASMPQHLREHLSAGRHVQGIFILNRKMSFGQTIKALALIWSEGNLDEYRDRITYLRPVS
jgi:hypothetical protein